MMEILGAFKIVYKIYAKTFETIVNRAFKFDLSKPQNHKQEDSNDPPNPIKNVFIFYLLKLYNYKLKFFVVGTLYEWEFVNFSRDLIQQKSMLIYVWARINRFS